MKKTISERIKSALENHNQKEILALLKEPETELEERIQLLEKAEELGEERYSEELEILRKFLKETPEPEIISKLNQLSPEGFSSLVRFLIKKKEFSFLEQLLGSDLSRGKTKLIKKALHRLRSQGINISEKPQPAPAERWQEVVFKKWVRASPVLSWWAEMVVFYFVSGARENLFLLAQLDLGEGFKELKLLSLAEKEVKRIINSARERSGILIELEEEHFHWLSGYALSKTTSEAVKKQAREYLEKLKLKPAEASWDNHPISELKNQISPEEQIGLIYDADKLLEHPYFRGWGFEVKTLEECSRQLESALTSPLELSPAQLQERLEEIIEKYALIPLEENPEKIRYALWENAYFLVRTGQKELGKIALALAENLSHPRARDFFKKILLAHFPRLKDKLDQKPDLIITP